MSSILQLWDVVVVSVAVIAITAILLGLMIRVIEPPNALRRIGAALGCMVILIVVLPIIMHLWGRLSLWQRLGVVGLGLAVTLTCYPNRPGRGQ